jgi:tyrosine-protein kinase
MSDQVDGRTTLRDYVAVVRRRKWILLQAVVLVPLVAVLLSQLQEARYESSSTVLLNRQSLAATLTGSSQDSDSEDPVLLGRTQAQVAQVPALAVRVLRVAGMSNRSASEFLASSRVEPVAQTDVVLRFTVGDQDPKVAERLANAYAHQYIRYRRELDTAAYSAARRQLEERMRKLRDDGIDTESPLYASLLEQHQTLVTLSELQQSNASVLRAAEGATQISPRTRLAGILGAFVGIVLGLGLAFLRETFDRRVRPDHDLDSALDLPLLGRLPAPPRRAKQGELAMMSRPSTAEAESFRLLGANLEHANMARQARTIMVTSASRGEGKTTIVANLAVALARAGRRIALVDLDVRHPSLDRIFGLSDRPGLSDVVLDDMPLSDALARVPLAAGDPVDVSGTASLAAGTLDVLPVGSTPPTPAEFVASRAVARVLDELSGIFDVVLVDVPPLLAVSDAVILGARVDAVLVAVRLNVTDREILNDLARALNACPCAKLGYVLTGAEPHKGYYVPARTSSDRPSKHDRAVAPVDTRLSHAQKGEAMGDDGGRPDMSSDTQRAASPVNTTALTELDRLAQKLEAQVAEFRAVTESSEPLHVREENGVHICDVCGREQMSAAGLAQHKAAVHVRS